MEGPQNLMRTSSVDQTRSGVSKIGLFLMAIIPLAIVLILFELRMAALK